MDGSYPQDGTANPAFTKPSWDFNFLRLFETLERIKKNFLLFHDNINLPCIVVFIIVQDSEEECRYVMYVSRCMICATCCLINNVLHVPKNSGYVSKGLEKG